MERGNLCFDVKGAIQVEAPQKNMSTKAKHRGGLIRISDEAVERQWSEGIELSVLFVSQPEMG